MLEVHLSILIKRTAFCRIKLMYIKSVAVVPRPFSKQWVQVQIYINIPIKKKERAGPNNRITT